MRSAFHSRPGSLPDWARAWRQRLGFIAAGCVLAVQGCSGDGFQTARVTGTVTLDGRPLEGAQLEFEPPRAGKTILPAAYGMTDAAGHYELRRSGGNGGAPGAVVGMNTVRISSSEGGAAQVHPHYSGDGAFQREVVIGPNVIDFELESKPKIR
jgi:hypothetical protein